MQIVLDNIIYSLQRTGGISVVWTNLLERLLNVPDIRFHIIEYSGYRNIFRDSFFIPEVLIEKRCSLFLNVFRYLPLCNINVHDNFIFHSSYYRVCLNKNAINITTVHDFTYEYFCKGWKRKLHSWQKNRAIRSSDFIVCISENTKRDLIRFLPDINPAKIRVIYNGVSDDYYRLEKIPYPQYKDYVLFIGARDDYKNFMFTVDALRETRFKLLICGKKLSVEEIGYLNQKLGSERYLLKTNISNIELNNIYNSVYCLSYPSSYEGFGIPVLEAQKAGCPVISLNASSIPEIIGDDYPRMENLSIKEFVRLLDLYEDIDSRLKVCELGLRNVSRFSWDKMFQGYYTLYKEIMNNMNM